MQYTAIAKDGGLFIPNISQFAPNELLTLDIQRIERLTIDDDNEDCLDDVIVILKGVDGVAFQNALREE